MTSILAVHYHAHAFLLHDGDAPCRTLQRHYIRILWMVPIYSVESWLALRFNKQKVYLETLREAYEAFVVYSLYKLMREYMGDKPMVGDHPSGAPNCFLSAAVKRRSLREMARQACCTDSTLLCHAAGTSGYDFVPFWQTV